MAMSSRLNRRQFLCSTVATALPAAAAGARPNIVFLLPDQLRAQALGCMGNPDVKTPNFDRLAASGILLKNTFANTPVCCPARAVLLTGKYASANGMIANDLRFRESEVTIAKILGKAGYRTGFIGKWHLDGGPRLPGFVPPGARRQGFEFWAANECSHAHYNTQYFRDTPEPIPMKKFEAEGWADLALEFLDGKQPAAKQRDPRPFFVTIQMGPPHDPYKAPPEYAQLYDPEKLTMRPNYQLTERAPSRQAIAEYYGMVTAVDHQLGRIMGKLEELGLANNTIFLVCSDHGDMLGSQGERLKRKPWEESIRVPGMIRWPAQIKPAQQSEMLFSHVDIAPTLLGMCGVPVPPSMQGRNLASAITTGKGATPESVYFQIFGPYQGDDTPQGWRGVRTAKHMYARFEDKPWVLYDIEADPYEQKNLADDPAAKPIRQQMEKHLQHWMKSTGDSWSKNWNHLVEDAGHLYKQGTFHTVDEYLSWAAKNGVKVLRR